MIAVPQVNAAHLPQGGFRRRFMASKREQILTGRTTGKLSATLTPMQIHLLRSKIHHALVTDANVEYEGCLTIDYDLMEKVRMLPYEFDEETGPTHEPRIIVLGEKKLNQRGTQHRLSHEFFR